MYESLKRHCPDFHLYVFPMDEDCRSFLEQLNLQGVTVVAPEEFEDERLRRIKPLRSHVEYCWTCTPFIILHVLKKYSVECCTYLDADLYFFSSPQPLLDELRDHAVVITEHRYAPDRDQTSSSGRFNVQFMPFRNNDMGLAILDWWCEACLDACELNPEKGRCGDQKYLDDWPERFEGVHVLEHVGGWAAPWNMERYEFFLKDGKLRGREIGETNDFEIIFYHFCDFLIANNGILSLGGEAYSFFKDIVELLYKPYILHLHRISMGLKENGCSFDPDGPVNFPVPRRIKYGIWIRKMLHRKNSSFYHFSDFVYSE